MCAESLAPSQRHAYTHNGRLIYEWDQTLTEVNLYIQVPAGVRAKNLAIDIKAAHLSVGIKGNPPYLDLDFAGRVKPADSFWTLEDNIISLQLCKAEKGQPWTAALAGHDVDPVKQQEEQQRLMLERFQQEHPGFDFSGAKFSGQAPNPRTFMGGMTEQ